MMAIRLREAEGVMLVNIALLIHKLLSPLPSGKCRKNVPSRSFDILPPRPLSRYFSRPPYQSPPPSSNFTNPRRPSPPLLSNPALTLLARLPLVRFIARQREYLCTSRRRPTKHQIPSS